MSFKDSVADSLYSVLSKHLSKKEIMQLIEIPKDNSLGDYAFPAFSLTKKMKKDPKKIAFEISKELGEIYDKKHVSKIEAAGPYINFFINKETLAETVVSQILREKEKYGFSDSGKNKTILVEFSQPNTNKPQHIGHVRNDILGDSIVNVFRSQGYKTFGINLINDRGIHICKSMLAYMKWGNNSTPESEGVKGDRFVGNYYVLYAKKLQEFPDLDKEALQLLNKWEQGDKEVVALWKKMNKWVLEGFDETYKDLGIKFDKVYYESNLYKHGKKIILNGLKKGKLKKEEGAILAPLEQFGLPDKVLIRSDGTSIYMTQDIYLAKKKHDDYKFDKSIYVVASEQNLHFKQLFKILELLGFDWADKNYHLSYGMVNLPSGRMKSREGTVVDADDLLNDLKELAEKEIKSRYKNLLNEEINERSEKIALAAIKFYMLKIDAVKDLLFKPEESISFEGETGPYILYSYARAKNILKKAEEERKGLEKDSEKISYSLLKEKTELDLIALLYKYPKILEDSLKHYSLHLLCRYLLDVAASFNSFYHSSRVIGEDNDVMQARLALVKASSLVLKNGLNMLGIKVLEQM